MIPLAGVFALAAAIPLPLEDLGGNAVSVDPAQHKFTVVVFVSTVCPISNDYADRLVTLHKHVSVTGARLLLVYSNRTESTADVRANAEGNGFAFPVYRDPRNRLADRLDARVTPTAFVLDARGEVRFSGKIDDATNPARVTKRYVDDAIQAVSAGRAPEVSRVEPYG